MLAQLKQLIRGTESFHRLVEQLSSPGKRPVPLTVTGVAGSLSSLLVAAIHEETGRGILVVARDRDTADRLRDDIAAALPQSIVLSFSGDHSRGNDPGKDAADTQALRAVAVEPTVVLVTHPHGLVVPVPAPEQARGNSLTIEAGSAVSLSETRDALNMLGFERKEFVEVHGDYAVRGGILDVFPFGSDAPVRIEFLGDEVESIRQFDPLSQRSIKDLAIAVIVPDLYRSTPDDQAEDHRLPEYLPSGTIVFQDEPELIRQTFMHPSPSGIPAIAPEEVRESLAPFSNVHVTGFSGEGAIDFDGVTQPSFNGSMKVLREHLAELLSRNYRVMLLSDGHVELNRLKELLASPEAGAQELPQSGVPALDLKLLEFSLESLHEGFTLPAQSLAVYTEHQIFGRLRRRGKKRGPKFKGFSQKELQQLRRGDFVVHKDYGIGRFIGLKRIQVRNAEQEVVSVQYEGNDMLYVNLNYINRLQKYSSKDGHLPKLNRLGSNEWDRLKTRVKARVKDIARDLIRLYAKRKHTTGFAFRADTPWQHELEASFMYEDTFDQAKATREVKMDMELSAPMDRLICGDVGFGKTEVAVRAAFKAVVDGKQVALLVPTTILATQHYHTFLDRTSRYAVRVDVLSRFKSKKEQVKTLTDLKAGQIDILIGTHRLLSKDVDFRNLGLLIIDEEHRFGVAAKEKLRLLRMEVDTLALTATPIPRTLHFSLMGARDLSIIATAPRNRLPIFTEIVQWNDDLIREAVSRELQRGGQVYFVHDRVQNMDDLLARLHHLLPGVRIRFAHGQMRAHELENVMMEFLERKFDMLVATKIIESGLDIPSVNTIIVNRADRFGMAELYQLRGRVGRSNVQAYAYLITPPISMLPRPTLQRLQALEEFNELGSGFNLAMRDLEIRGAGNLLGGEQSGFIETMGFETYTRVLEEAVNELKDEEFRELFQNEPRAPKKEDVVIEADVNALIPDSYIGNDTERLATYRRLYALETEEQIREISDELRDRFGNPPDEVELLYDVVRIKLLAGKIGFRRVRISEKSLEAEFPPDSDTQFYESDDFQLLMTAVSRGSGRTSGLRQEGSTLSYYYTFASPLPPTTLLEEALQALARLHHARESLRVSVTSEN
ncbi:MAG: transcription-repair coupling factor [Bacteroidota bacterium]